MHDLVGRLLVSGQVVPEPRRDQYVDDIDALTLLTWLHLSNWSADFAFGCG